MQFNSCTSHKNNSKFKRMVIIVKILIVENDWKSHAIANWMVT
jgi:hypothetical protein